MDLPCLSLCFLLTRKIKQIAQCYKEMKKDYIIVKIRDPKKKSLTRNSWDNETKTQEEHQKPDKSFLPHVIKQIKIGEANLGNGNTGHMA